MTARNEVRAREIRAQIAALENELAEAEGVLPLVEDLTGEADYVATLCAACILATDADRKDAMAALAERLATRLAARLDLLPKGTAK